MENQNYINEEDLNNFTFSSCNGRIVRRIKLVTGENISYWEMRGNMFCLIENGDMWVVQQENGVEICRHNVKHIISIYWK